MNTAEELDAQIRDIAAFDNLGQSEQICGALYVNYSDESVKEASLISWLENRGVTIVWRRK